MPTPSTAECTDDRFSLYVEELREFLAVSRVSFGTPENVGTFIEMLSRTGSFRGETSSMVRSVIYRELGGIQKPELERLLLIAVGGADATTTLESSESGRALLSRLKEFVDRAFIKDPFGPHSDEAVDSQNVDPVESALFGKADSFHSNELPMPQWVDWAKKDVLDGFPQAEASEVKPQKTSRQHLVASFYSRAGLVTSNAAEIPDPPDQQKQLSLPVQPGIRQSHWALGLVMVVSLSVAGGLLYDRHQVRAFPTVSNSQPTNKSSIPSTPVSTAPVRESKGRVSSAASKRPHAVTNSKRNDQAAIVTGRTALQSEDRFPVKPAASRVTRPADLRYAKISSKSNFALLGEDEDEDIASTESLWNVSERSEHPTRLQQFDGRSGMSYSSGIMSANAVSVVPPKYPRLANFAHVQGAVVMQAVIARDGTVAATRVLSGPRLLRGAATSAVRRWRYRPYVMNGQVAEVATIITVNFSLPRR